MQDKMQEPSLDACELASALADGELQEAEISQALRALKDSAVAQERWHTYHLVGDVLRSGAAAAVSAHDAAFVAALRPHLAREAPRPAPVIPVIRSEHRHSANEGVWRWKLVAGLASVAVVALLGWQLAGSYADGEAGGHLARITVPAAGAVAASTPAAASPTMIRDPRLDQLIAEHQQLGGTSALQMPAGFLRNATFERPAR